jgi:hypothetical protein
MIDLVRPFIAGMASVYLAILESLFVFSGIAEEKVVANERMLVREGEILISHSLSWTRCTHRQSSQTSGTPTNSS